MCFSLCKSKLERMKKFFLIPFLVFVFNSLLSQDLQYARQQVDTLAGPTFSGRGYVNNGMNKAAEYLKKELREIGLMPINENYLQQFTFPVNTFPSKAEIKLNTKELVPGKDFLLDPASGSAKGKFNLFLVDSSNIGEIKFNHIPKKSALVVNPANINDEVYKDKLNALMAGYIKSGPVILLTGEKFTWAVSKVALPFPFIELQHSIFDFDSKKIGLNIQNKFVDNFNAENVIAYIPGKSETDSFLVFTAHYDHLGMMGSAIFPGASDNASGTAMLLDLAKHYKENPPEYNVAFVFFAAEEAGLVGSEYYVANPLFPLSQIKLLVNLDLMGGGSEGITVVNGKQYPTLMAKLNEVNAEKDYLPQIKERGPAANSDHYWFSENGVQAVFIYTLGGVTAYHDINDTRENLPLSNYEEVFSLIRDFTDEYLK